MAQTAPTSSRPARRISVFNIVRALCVIVVLAIGVVALFMIHGTSRYDQALRYSIAFFIVDGIAAWVMIELHLHPRRRRRLPVPASAAEVSRPAG